MKKVIFLIFTSFIFIKCNKSIQYDIVVIGGTVSGTCSALQIARMNVNVLLIEETPWLGGMLTSAGVSATDGNHNLLSGIWSEFRDSIRIRYGGVKAVESGWVSNTIFEPNVGATVFFNMAKQEKKLQLAMETCIENVIRYGDYYKIKTKGTFQHTIKAKIIIDATELGDIVAKLNVPYYIGTDAPNEFDEMGYAIEKTKIVQDFTMVGLLKNYGTGVDKTISKPENYNADEFVCACKTKLCKSKNEIHTTKNIECDKMMTYAKTPNNYIILNWPGHFGNDFYGNFIEESFEVRNKYYDSAKQKTLRYIYFIQQELGLKHLSLSNDIFPTHDGFPFYPYFRESRRIEGKVKFGVKHIVKPFNYNLYKTGIAVGDYPIDHHHSRNNQTPNLKFPKVASFNIPMGSLIPKNVENLIVAEKSISVSNLVNGSTRLQPCVMTIGQAAGVIAALAIIENKKPSKISIRKVQETLLEFNAYIMPYFDVKPDHPHFKEIQKTGAMGLIHGVGEPYQWANRTWFYPDSLINYEEFKTNLLKNHPKKLTLLNEFIALDSSFKPKTRLELSIWLNKKINFTSENIDFLGNNIN